MSGAGTRRVVVTGVGAVASLGNDAETIWRRLVAGESGAGPITAFDASSHPVRVAFELKGFEPATWIERRNVLKMDRFTQLAVAAARMAAEDSGLDVAGECDRVGISLGTGHGGLATLEHCHATLRELGVDRIHPRSIPAMIPNMNAGWVSIELGACGPLNADASACAASNMAIGAALDLIRLGRADVVFAGGSEAAITPLGIGAYGALRALSRRNGDPRKASRPFDAERDGFVMGEGAGVLVLEELEHARRRQAQIYAELAGFGAAADGYHVTDPDPTGRGASRAMQLALEDAGIAPEDVSYVSAHATGTPRGDVSETLAIKRLFGPDLAQRIPISSTKGALGHCLGASGALEGIVAVFALQRDVVPPTLNLEHEDPSCDLDYVPNEARETTVDVAISNNLGFGGHNSALVFRKLRAA
jgi:3-oxoacyl-[acyl-carrier-protein] synthase II